MSVDISLKLKPFIVPNFVTVETPPGTRQEGFRESPKLSLAELSAEVINKLVDDFRDDVFKRRAEQRESLG